MSNVVFHFGEASLWVTTPSGGLASLSVDFIRTHSIPSRTPVRLEDGSVAYFRDRHVFTSPWVNDDVATLFSTLQPVDLSLQWSNTDDGRLRSDTLLGAFLIDSRKLLGTGEAMEYQFTFEGYAMS